MSSPPIGGWVAVTDYPAWQSPYFAELHRNAPPGLPLGFVSTLDALPEHPAQAGVINLHRLKRLYRNPDGQRTLTAAKALLERLQALRDGGWRIVWTVHNLLPIDGGSPREADWCAALGVLGIADAVLTHTCSDARYLARLTKAPIVVAGWAGLSVPKRVAPASEPVRALVHRLRDAPFSVLVVGNLVTYKGLPAVVKAFTAHTQWAHLFIAGPCRDDALAADLKAAAVTSGGRVHVHPERIPPEHLHRLYRAADAALCPYRVNGSWEVFTRVLYPGSVSTALAFGTPVIAPDLPAIAEMTANSPAWLYPPGEGPGRALAAAENASRQAGASARRSPGDGTAGWRPVTAIYQRIFEQLTGPNAPSIEPGLGIVTGLPDPHRRASRQPAPAAPEGDPSMSNSMNDDPESERGDHVAAALAGSYGLTARTITQLPIGQGTINFRVVCDDGQEVFVKNYPGGTDLFAERGAIALSTRALEAGIPGAQVLLNQAGDTIDSSSLLAVSVWEWAPGQVITCLTLAQLAAAGTALGRIHALFAGDPVPAAPAVEQWRGMDIEDLAVTIDQLLDIVADRVRAGIADAFDAEAQRTLLERRDMLARIPELLADLPGELTTQVLHGDYSPVNLLFTGETLSAVLDFRPPDPFLLAYDLGRMAFYPNIVTGEDRWLDAAAIFIGAYRQAHPGAPGVDVRACGRVALLQLLKSLYGVKQHYLKPGLFQDDLDDFWLLRHQAANTLLSELAATDALLTELAGT